MIQAVPDSPFHGTKKEIEPFHRAVHAWIVAVNFDGRGGLADNPRTTQRDGQDAGFG
jgi:hypothetical protein